MSKDTKDIKAIFWETVEKPNREEQQAYLDEVCGDDTETRSRVVELLRAHENADTFLETPLMTTEITVDSSPLTEAPGTVIDRYRLLEKIGEGGMAVVYMADQEKPVRRKVALKIIKLGMDTKSVIARFDAERQALAMMDHPNIARIIDAGATETGRPYFVMDLVPGLPITEYCDRNRLNIRERLRLFALTCNAVQHAHQKGIIHRDVKPSNVIVTQHDGKPVPKVIDFGIAKATDQRLTEKTLFTRFAHIIGTPAYMSPEQAELSDLDIDTRTDIYSLGVLLYELLTGTTPFSDEQLREAGYLQMQRIICEEEPTKPSTKLSTLGEKLTDVAKWHNASPEAMPRLVRGDLDWIVMKSLEKDRSRRYTTASEFAADVERHLKSEPVQARAPSFSYKVRKFVRRNRLAVAASSLILVSLLAVAVVSAMYGREADLRASEAEVARENAVTASQEITDLLAGSYVDQAQTLCEQGHVGRGMLWLAESLRTAPPGSDDLEQAIRTSLAAWSRQTHKLTNVVQYPASINAVTFSPDGSQILATCRDGIVRLCDSATGRPIGKPLPHGTSISVAEFSPDGTLIATGGRDGSARLWNASTLEPVGEAVRHGPTSLSLVLFTHDSSRLITGTRESIRIWDSSTGEPTGESFQIEGVQIRAVACCPDGIRAMVTTGRQLYQLFDVASGELIGPPLDHGRTAYAVAISPDGKRLVTGNDLGTVGMWDAATGQQVLGPMSHGGTILTLAFSPDGSRIVSGGASRIARLWDVTSGVQIGSPMRQRNTVTTVAFSPDGTRLVTGNQDGAVQQWDLVRNRHAGETVGQQDQTLRGATFARGGLWLLTQTEDTVQFRDADTGKFIGKPFTCSEAVRFRALSPDGSRLVTDGRRNLLSVWDVMEGKLVGEVFHPSNRRVVFSPDGSRFLSASSNNTAKLWDATTLKCLGVLRQHQSVVSGIAFSPDGSQFLTGSFDGTTQLWDTATLEPVGRPLVHQSEVKDLAFSPDGSRILIGFADGTVRLWHADTLEPIGTPLQHVELVSVVAFVPDGSQLLASSIDGTARLWDSATLKPVGPPLEHNPSWSNLVVSPDDSRILFYRLRGARVWQAPPRPLAGDRERIVCWAQVVTGMELDSTGGINVLDVSTWQERRQRLEELGGSPLTNSPPPDHGLSGGSEVHR